MDAGFIAYAAQKNLFNRLETLSNNVANVDTAGFKADFNAYYTDNARYKHGPNPVPNMTTAIDASTGGLKTTGRQLDVAIDGKGFLQFDTPLGARYSRSGQLFVNPEGQLVSKDGFPLAGGVTIDPNDTDISIGANGDVVSKIQDGDIETNILRGNLGVVTFADPGQMQKVGNSYFTTAQNADAAIPGTDYRIVQGALENSNVNSVEQMTQLVDISKRVQNLTNIIQSESQLMKSAIQRIAAVQ